jgi:hypothetical protein
MSSAKWISEDTRLDKPSAARMYDYLLGGYHNFAVDRSAAEQLIAINPDAPLVMQAYRAFLRRAVKFLVGQGIDQFLDIGSVTPTAGSAHEVAQQLNPAVKVVYADIDPDTVRHSEAILRDNPTSIAIQVDVRQPELLLSDPNVTGLLDFRKPAAVLVALLHYITDDAQAYRLVRTLRDGLAPGSYIAISHGSYENAAPEVVDRLEALFANSTTPAKLRSREQIAAFFEGLELVEPGLVYIPQWRPEGADDIFLDEPAKSASFSGIGRKR